MLNFELRVKLCCERFFVHLNFPFKQIILIASLLRWDVPLPFIQTSHGYSLRGGGCYLLPHYYHYYHRHLQNVKAGVVSISAYPAAYTPGESFVRGHARLSRTMRSTRIVPINLSIITAAQCENHHSSRKRLLSGLFEWFTR